MDQILSQIVIAVTANEAGCRAEVLSRSQRVLGFAVTGFVNIRTDYLRSRKNILRSIRKAWVKAGQSPNALNETLCVLSLAGSESSESKARLQLDLPFRNTFFADLPSCAYSGAFGHTEGTLIHLETQCFVIAKSRNETASNFKKVYHPTLAVGAEGSGQWLGTQLLRYTLKCCDGLLEHSDLTQSVVDLLKTECAIEYFSTRASPEELTRLAFTVVRACEAGDPIAKALITDVIAYFEICIAAVHCGPNAPICLDGQLGVRLKPHFPNHIKRLFCEPKGDWGSGSRRLAIAYQELAVAA